MLHDLAKSVENTEKLLSHFHRDEAGSTVVVFAVLLPVMVAALAMVADVSLWRHSARQLQLRADAAAVAGAHEVTMLDEKANPTLAAMGLLHDNGVNLATTEIAVHYPPISGTYEGGNAVQVILRQNQSRFFSSVFMSGDVSMQRISTAVIRSGTNALCILALDRSAPSTLDLTGSSSVDVNGCAVQSNSRHAQGLEAGGTSTLSAGCIYSSGGVYGEARMTVKECDQVETDWRQLPDPYADLEPPAGIASMACKTAKKTGKQSLFLESGRYCKSVVAMDYTELEDGGTFIFDNAVLDMKSASSELYGRNITLIFVNGGTIGMPTGGMMDLTAKTSGEYAGMLMYADRATTPSTLGVKITGHPDSKLEGVLYFPNQAVEFTGGSNSDSTCTHLIARTIALAGNASFSNQSCEAMGAREMALIPGVVLSST